MKKISVVFALFFTLLIVSCNSSKKIIEDISDLIENAGKLGGECYPDKTCSGDLICDEEKNLCVENSANQTTDSDTDLEQNDEKNDTESINDEDTTDTASTYDEDITEAQDSDFTDTADDSETTEPEDSTSDHDDDTIYDSSDSMDDSDFENPNLCDPNPCSDIENSTGECNTLNTTQYVCECKENYSWNEEEVCISKRPNLGNICTGLTTCYEDLYPIRCLSGEDDYHGQDAEYNKCRQHSFKEGEGIVIDNNTGLIWEQSPSTDSYTWNEAVNHCSDLNSSNYGGYNDWRVPNPMEFLTIVDNGSLDHAVSSPFTNMPTDNANPFWTSKEFNSNTSQAYVFQPDYGGISTRVKSTLCKVLCVHGSELPNASLKEKAKNSRLILIDSTTGLIWQRDNAPERTWKEALQYCENSNTAGFTDWRLPNKNELASLLNLDKPDSPYIDIVGTLSDYYWSSSTVTGYTGYAWTVHFYQGKLGTNRKSSKITVKCVR